ncbi:hypothetical protein NMG60_11003679 [Bertholletia excelsa]
MVKFARSLLEKVDNQLPPLVQSPPVVVVVEPNHNHSSHRSLETLVVVLAVITIVAVIAGIIARLCRRCIDGGVSAAPPPRPDESKPATEAPKPATEAKK